MRKLLLVLVINLGCALLATNAFARRRSVEDQKQELEGIFEKSVRQSLGQLKKRAGFALDPASLELTVHAMESVEEGREIGNPVVEILGSFNSESGTKLWLEAKGEMSGYAPLPFSLMFDTQLVSRGYDREGNAIDGKCHLTGSGYLSISNDKAKRVVTTFPLPTNLFINLSGKK
jgi:hypothetical protein